MSSVLGEGAPQRSEIGESFENVSDKTRPSRNYDVLFYNLITIIACLYGLVVTVVATLHCAACLESHSYSG